MKCYIDNNKRKEFRQKETGEFLNIKIQEDGPMAR